MHSHLRNLLWIVLLPLSWLWAGVAWVRRRHFVGTRQYRSTVKVLSIGNVHSGGSGKTPLVLECIRHFKAHRPAVLSRGYGGTESKKGAKLDRTAATQGPILFGDEPWMLAQQADVPIYVDRNRARALKKIEADGESKLVVLDDGFQHVRVARDVDLVLINVERDPLESFCLPLGDLREPMQSLRAATAVVFIASGTDNVERWQSLIKHHFPDTPVFTALRRPAGIFDGTEKVELPASTRVMAFSGIAQPRRFQSDLAGFCDVSGFAAFPDHHIYSYNDTEILIDRKHELNADALVTTDKDWYKVIGYFKRRGEAVYSLRIGYDIPSNFWYFLEQRLG